MECRLQLDEKEYIGTFRFEMMEIVYMWCKGVSFAEICKMTTIYEGSIIRCIRNLEEILRQMVFLFYIRRVQRNVLEMILWK